MIAAKANSAARNFLFYCLRLGFLTKGTTSGWLASLRP